VSHPGSVPCKVKSGTSQPGSEREGTERQPKRLHHPEGHCQRPEFLSRVGREWFRPTADNVQALRSVMRAYGYRDTRHFPLTLRSRQLLVKSFLDDLQLEALHDPLLKNLTSE
jgi:hypothetical protein